MINHRFLVVAFAIGLAACGAESATTLESVDVPADRIPFADPSTATTDQTSATPGSTQGNADASDQRDDVIWFIAAVERSIAGSVNEGIVYENPELFVGAAQVMCERLRNDEPLDVVVSDYLVDFTGSSVGAEAADDELLVGSIVGAGIETLCPDQGHRL